VSGPIASSAYRVDCISLAISQLTALSIGVSYMLGKKPSCGPFLFFC